MKKERIKDPEYKAHVEGLPCYLCGHIPQGGRRLYSEYRDEYYTKPCRNTAHHVDKDMTRAKNDHKLLPMCGHFVVSGRGTENCHEKVHGEKDYKSSEAIDKFNVDADEYYNVYLEGKDD